MKKSYIPKNIKRKDILKAINEIREKGFPPRRKADKYLVEYKGIYYPPKYVISLANYYANGGQLKFDDFYSGERVIEFLKNKMFKMVEFKSL